jgi:hypothetical protein
MPSKITLAIPEHNGHDPRHDPRDPGDVLWSPEPAHHVFSLLQSAGPLGIAAVPVHHRHRDERPQTIYVNRAFVVLVEELHEPPRSPR